MNQSLKVVTWNLGALQTSLFEFWQEEGSHLRHVQDQLDQVLRSKTNVLLLEIVTHEMIHELSELSNSGKSDILHDAYRSLADRSVHAFLTNPEIGRKRFVSMPDRVLREHPQVG